MNQASLQIFADKILSLGDNFSQQESIVDAHSELIDKNSLYHTRGLYASLTFKDNGVKGEFLADHIKYNLLMRPGRAFFVNGVCFNTGYLPAIEIEAAKVKLQGVKATRDTQPYQ